MDDFVIVDDVPVFDQHDEYDEAALQEIVDNNNRRIADTGDCVPLVIGHTDPELPELTLEGGRTICTSKCT